MFVGGGTIIAWHAYYLKYIYTGVKDQGMNMRKDADNRVVSLFFLGDCGVSVDCGERFSLLPSGPVRREVISGHSDECIGCLLRNVVGTFIRISESRTGIKSTNLRYSDD